MTTSTIWSFCYLPLFNESGCNALLCCLCIYRKKVFFVASLLFHVIFCVRRYWDFLKRRRINGRLDQNSASCHEETLGVGPASGLGGSLVSGTLWLCSKPTLRLVTFKWTWGLLVPSSSVGAASSEFTCWFLLEVSGSRGLGFFVLWGVATPPGQLPTTINAQHIHIQHIITTQSHTHAHRSEIMMSSLLWLFGIALL